MGGYLIKEWYTIKHMYDLFISFRFTGEDPAIRKQEIDFLIEKLQPTYPHIYCSLYDDFFEQEGISYADIIERTLDMLSQSKKMLIYVKSSEKSEGMLIEVGYAIAKNIPMEVYIKKGVSTTFLRDVTDRVVEFEGLF